MTLHLDSTETLVANFVNSEGHFQIVTDGPGAKCPTCGYPERHRIYSSVFGEPYLAIDGCPTCETPRTAPEKAVD